MAVSGVTDLGGRVLTGRYRLLGAIGSGASGRVYVADDTRLRRQVAVKVLHTALADDAGFLARFRKEAQLAGSLHHPNIVTVYDWGEDDVPFMVLELLRGGSLRNVLDTGARLSPAQAAHVGRQVTDALEYAHGRGLIHRDIKPSNLLFDEHGIVRIADFGLARALAEASFTEPTGSLLGTARYASPEQATGAPLDARSDLYAVSLVLAESVAGRVPNVADTPLGTLGLRTQRSVLAPEELGPLGAVVERAGQRDPDQRYPDAATMRDGLVDVGRHLPPPTPLPLAGLGSSTIEDPNPTQIVGAAQPTVFDQDADIEVITDTSAPGRRKAWIAPTLLAVALIAVLTGIGALLIGSPAPPVTMPGLVGLDEATATATATEAGLEVDVQTRASADPAGTVLSQDPAAGVRVGDGSTVTLVISSGPPPVALPEIAGRPLADVQPELEEAGFLVEAEWVFSDDVPEGIVIGTDPEGMTEAAPESRIVLVVSDGPPPVTVTAMQGKTYEEAVAELEAMGFTVVRAEDYSEDIAVGHVIGTDPGPGVEAPYGSSITVVVSLGPPLVAVPDVIGMSVEEATSALEALGLEADVSNYRPGRIVLAVSPGVGTMVEPGTTVTLTL